MKTVKALSAVLFWIGIFYAFFHIFKQLSLAHISRGPSIAILVSAALCSLSTVGVLAFLVQRRPSGRVLSCVLLVCITADVSLNRSIIARRAEQPHVESASAPDENPLVHHLAGINLSLLGIALCGGLLVSGAITKPSYLIPLSVVAGIADVWSVAFGATKQIAVSKTAANYFLLNFPVSGQGVQPLIGAVDFLFAAMYMDLSQRFGLSAKRTLSVLIVAFLVSISVAAFLGAGIPVLPAMAAGFILAHRDRIRIVDPKEKRDAVRGTAIVLGILATTTLLLKLFGY